MGFLTSYDGTERVNLGEPTESGHQYWVDIKKCLNRGDMERAEALLTSATTKREDGKAVTMDTASYRTYIVCASIVDWNLDDDDGNIWPCNNDAAIKRGVMRLPESAFDAIHQRVEQLNSPIQSRQRADFRQSSDDRDQNGIVGAGDTVEVSAGNGTVAAVRPTPGGSGAPPVA